MVGITGFFLCAIWLKELIQLATALLLSPHFGFKVKKFIVFNQIFTKEDDRWVRTKGKRSPLIQCLPTVDLSKYHEPGEMEKKEKQMEFLRVFILLGISTVLLLLCLRPILHIADGAAGFLDWFLAGLSTGLCWHSIVTLGIRIYVYNVMMKKLPGYVQSLINRLRAGERFSDMGLRPVEELPYKDPKPMEKMFYYLFYLPAMLESGQIGAMQKPVREMTVYFRDREYITGETGNYYWLIFYYSRFELNPAAATHFLNKIRPIIEQDKDANAKRVLAYYAFGIEQDFPKARALLNEAYAVIDKFSSYGEQELERKLLADLDGFLRAKGY
jgi:hypothetical protein